MNFLMRRATSYASYSHWNGVRHAEKTEKVFVHRENHNGRGHHDALKGTAAGAPGSVELSRWYGLMCDVMRRGSSTCDEMVL